MENNVKQAVDTLTAALKSDPDLFMAYQANIAMAVYDTYYPAHGGFNDPKPTDPEIHKICNDGAIRFLNLLCEDRPSEPALNMAPKTYTAEQVMPAVKRELLTLSPCPSLGFSSKDYECIGVLQSALNRLENQPLTLDTNVSTDAH